MPVSTFGDKSLVGGGGQGRRKHDQASEPPTMGLHGHLSSRLKHVGCFKSPSPGERQKHHLNMSQLWAPGLSTVGENSHSASPIHTK